MSDIPLVDLKAQLPAVEAEILEGWASVVKRTAFILGPEVKAFEAAFAEFCQVKACVGVGNGTDALEVALRALDVGVGDEVVLPANTFIASASAVARCGATPVLVDVDPVHYLMDTDAVAEAIGPRTKVVMPVHLYGQCARVEALTELCARKGVAILEDAAQCQGARRNGVTAGGLGTIAATSFYPGKNLGAWGDGGAVLTNDEALGDRARRLRNYGGVVKYTHHEPGLNSRLDTLQAVVLNAKLKRLSGWNDARRAAAARYQELLGDTAAVTLPGTLEGNEHVWHLYVVRVPNRDAVLKAMHEARVFAGIHYPKPIHQLEAFASLGKGPGSFPVAEKAAGEILSLPLFPEITGDQQARVVEVLKAALS